MAWYLVEHRDNFTFYIFTFIGMLSLEFYTWENRTMLRGHINALLTHTLILLLGKWSQAGWDDWVGRVLHVRETTNGWETRGEEDTRKTKTEIEE